MQTELHLSTATEYFHCDNEACHALVFAGQSMWIHPFAGTIDQLCDDCGTRRWHRIHR